MKDLEVIAQVLELNELVLGDNAELKILEAVADGRMAELVPEFLELRQDDSGRGRHKDNLLHTAKVVGKCPDRIAVRLAAFFHDIGKPATRRFESGKVTFYNHEAVGAGMTRRIMRRIGYAPKLTTKVSLIVELSGRVRGADDWTDSAVRRFVQDAGDALDDLLDFCYNDVTSSRPATRKMVESQVDTLRERISEVAEKDAKAALRPRVNGNQIMERFGLSPGPELGRLMKLIDPSMTETECWEVLEGAVD